MKLEKGSFNIYFISFFLIGAVSNILIVGFAMLYLGKGFTNAQIGTLTSIGFIGAIMQPIIGSACDVTGRKRFVLQLCFVLICSMLVIMKFNSNYQVYLICAFIISVVKMPLYGILDDISLSYCARTGKSYSKIRSGASFGFGLGVFILLPLNYINNIDVVLYMTFITCIITIIVLSFIPDEKHKNNKKERKQYYRDLKKIFKSRSILLIYFTTLIVMSVTSLKITYTNILFNQLGLSLILVALLNFAAAMPEMIILPNYERLFGKYSYKQMMIFLMVFSFLQVTIFAFTTNIYIMFLVIGFQGVVFASFVPTVFGSLKRQLEDDVSATGILTNSMIQSIGTFVISYYVITYVFKTYRLNAVFIVLGLINFLLIIPYLFYKEEEVK